MMKELLRQRNFNIVGEAESILEATARLKDIVPDIVLLDVRLNESNGLDLIDIIKKDMKNVKIVVCSAVNSTEVINDAIMRGADDYITKPFSCKKLFQILDNA